MAGIFCNPNVHYRVRNSPPLVPILCQMNSFHNVPSYFFNYFNIILPSEPSSGQHVAIHVTYRAQAVCLGSEDRTDVIQTQTASVK
jgi:hypothetical protein